MFKPQYSAKHFMKMWTLKNMRKVSMTGKDKVIFCFHDSSLVKQDSKALHRPSSSLHQPELWIKNC